MRRPNHSVCGRCCTAPKSALCPPLLCSCSLRPTASLADWSLTVLVVEWLQLRVFKLLRLGGSLGSLQLISSVAAAAIADAAQLLVALVMITLICMVVFAAGLYQFEPGECGAASPPAECGDDFGRSLGSAAGWFLSQTRTFWWGLVTLTGVGYGDEYPMRAFGRIIAVVAAAVGVIIVAVPIEVIGRFFTAHFKRLVFTSVMERLCVDKAGGGQVNLACFYQALKDLDRKGLLKIPCPSSADEVEEIVELYDGKGNRRLEQSEWSTLIGDLVQDRADFAKYTVRKIIRELAQLKADLASSREELLALMRLREDQGEQLMQLVRKNPRHKPQPAASVDAEGPKGS